MNSKQYNNIDQYFDKWKKVLINFGIQRNLLSKELENYINSIGIVEYEIYKALFNAKTFYRKKCDNYNQKIKGLKVTKKEYKEFLEYFKEVITEIPESKLVDKKSASIQFIKSSIEAIDEKVNTINTKLEEEPLNIEQENTLIARIQSLNDDKKGYLNDLKKLEQDLLKERQENIYFRTLGSIEILESDLKEIHEDLRKWSNKRLNSHKKMLSLYRKVREFEIIQKQMESELIKFKENANYYNQLFFDLIIQNKKQIIEEQIIKFRNREKLKKLTVVKQIEIQKPHVKEVIKQKKSKKKYLKKKLVIALDKKKAGKKLEFHELKLILDHSKRQKD